MHPIRFETADIVTMQSQKSLYTLAAALSVFTILYNIIEGLVSIWFGWHDESLALFGFGIDSFVEVASGLGIFWMIFRIQRNLHSSKSGFEIAALRITGTGFYTLAVALICGAILGFLEHHAPHSGFWGTVISIISIVIMGGLATAKIMTGRKLNSQPIVSDGRCTLVCLYMSVVLFVSSGIYTITGFAHSDSLGALGLAWFSFREGREAFEKARKQSDSCEC